MRIRPWYSLVLAAALVVAPAFADHHEKKDQAAPSAEEQAMMEAWMKAATPSDAHKKLEPFVGTWNTKVTAWMAPGAEPMVSTGTSVNSWILDGRWVKQDYQGSFMGQPFVGVGYTGYDNIRNEYVAMWMDNMSTAPMMTRGSLAADGREMTFSGKVDDPMTGKAQDVKEKIVIVDADHHNMEMWGPGPDGKMFKMMEIEYARSK